METIFIIGKPQVGDVVRQSGVDYRVVEIIAYHGGGVGTNSAVVNAEPVEKERRTGLRLVKRDRG